MPLVKSANVRLTADVDEAMRGTCIYSFVLHAPPVALEQVEGALEQQRVLLQSELATLKSLMEH